MSNIGYHVDAHYKSGQKVMNTRALEAYRKGLANIDTKNKLHMIQHMPQPTMMGGGWSSDLKHPLQGISNYNVSTDYLAVGNYDAPYGALKKNKSKIKSEPESESESESDEELFGEGMRRRGRPRKAVAGKVNRKKKAEHWTDFSVNTVKKGLDLYDKGRAVAGKVNRKKKAEHWTDFSVNTVKKGLDLYDKGRAVAGKVNRKKKAEHWTDFSVNTVKKGLDLYDKGRAVAGAMYYPESLIKATGAGKSTKKNSERVSCRTELIKKLMKDKGMSMIEASKYIKQNKLY